MVEHNVITDAERHEPKGASTAADNTALKSNGDGTTTFDFVDWAEITGKPTIPTEGTAVPDSTASTVAEIVADFNTLLASLRASNAIDT